VFGRVSTAAVAKLKATAVVAACATAGSLGGAVALRQVAPVRHAGAPAAEHRTAPEPTPTATPSSAPTPTWTQTHQSPKPSKPEQPVAAPHSVPSTSAPTMPMTTRPGEQVGSPAPTIHHGAPKSRAGASRAPEHSSPPEAAPSPTPTATNTPEGCDGNHGDEVSQVAHGNSPGDGPGGAVPVAAHDDCGTGQPPQETDEPQQAPDQHSNGHDKG